MHAETACGIDSGSRVRIRPSSCGLSYSVLQSSSRQRVIIRERVERQNGADSECGTIGWVYWTRKMVLDKQSEGVILVTFSQFLCNTEYYSVIQTPPA
jgi:hypothetical protein